MLGTLIFTLGCGNGRGNSEIIPICCLAYCLICFSLTFKKYLLLPAVG